MKKITVVIVFCCLPLLAQADDLLTIYRQASAHDPTYLQIKANNLANAEQATISFAKLLPQIGLDAQTSNENRFSNQGKLHADGFDLTAKQTVFDFSDWATFSAEKAASKRAALATAAALQNLMVRTAKAYFDVAQAENLLALNKKQRNAARQLFIQAQIEKKAGKLTATDVSNAQANYVTASRDVINRQITLEEKQAALTAITQQPTRQIRVLNYRIKLMLPHKVNKQKWLALSRSRNLTYLAARYGVLAAKRNVLSERGNHLPAVGVEASYGDQYTISSGDVNRERDSTITLKASVPLFSGGGIVASTRQAEYKYQAARQNMIKTKADAYRQAQQSLTSVITGQQQLLADLKLIEAETEDLTNTTYSYKAGQSSTKDVVEAQMEYYAAHTDYIVDKYVYLNGVLALKQAAGTLNINDLITINKLLH